VSGLDRTAARRSQQVSAERIAGRLLIVVTYISVVLLVVGFALMLADGISPLDGGPPLDLATIGAQLRAFEPSAFLWIGLLAVIAAPIGRVIVSGVSYARAEDRLMVAVSIGILVVIAAGVATALTVEV
jgi:uncharacterized membrane protein